MQLVLWGIYSFLILFTVVFIAILMGNECNLAVN